MYTENFFKGLGVRLAYIGLGEKVVIKRDLEENFIKDFFSK